MILGIDIGGTTTDIVGFNRHQVKGFLSVSADDPLASASGALGKFLNTHKLSLADIDSIAVTGVGATYLSGDLFGIPVSPVDEFMAIGMGGLFLARVDTAIVVSMGTGTAIVRAEHQSAQHLGGTGIGGGTLIGLAKYMLQVTDFSTLIEMAQQGSLSNVDLTIGDIASTDIGNLPLDATASNFGKHNDKASPNDLALGIINLVCQNIGTSAIFASQNSGIKTIVLTGKLTRLPQTSGIFKRLARLFPFTFLIPEKSEFSTAVGAAYTHYLNIKS